MGRLLELALRGSLIRADASRLNLGFEVVLAFYWGACNSSQYSDLSAMGESIGHRPLKKILQRSLQRRIGGQIIIELLQRGEEAVDFFIPRQRFGIVPLLFAVGHR